MKVLTVCGCLILMTLFVQCSKIIEPKADIVPLPQTVDLRDGTFEFDNKTVITISSDDFEPLAKLLVKHINTISELELSIIKEKVGSNSLELEYNQNLGQEEYRLNVDKNIRIEAANYNGMAMAVASVLQLASVSKGEMVLPYISITDKPDFEYRTVMLDLARFWHPVETIKETIDLLWFYKIKYLHLHLSDNRRFTFPLDEFPDLKTVNEDGSREYYTREELNDLVEYAKQRGIIIIPEVELPGHSGQLFTKYPEVFGSIDKLTGEAKYIHVINIAKEEAYEASKKIINQLAEVFYTSPYIHIGCDEVYLEVLKTVPEYRSFCKKHNLNVALNGDANELFCYFVNQLNEMVKAAGKQSIIWEGFHGSGVGSQSISKDIPVIVWNTSYNHPDSLRNNGFQIINSTWLPWYLVGAMNLASPQDKAYQWDVTKWAHWNEKMPTIELDSKDGINGGQICFWEQNHFKVISQLKDLVPVLSERLWSNRSNAGFADFKTRFDHTNSIYNKLFHPITNQVSGLLSEQDQTFSTTALVVLKSETPGTIKYVYSDSWKLPNMKTGSVYEKPFNIEKSGILSVQLFDEHDNAIGFPVQKYYQKIVPAYSYKVYGGAPQHGWTVMPDFTQLPLVREGISGLMNPERMAKINGELFAKVKKDGHIDTRFNGIYNPYALELNGKIVIPEKNDFQFRIQTHDGLAELYIDGLLVGKGTEFGNKPEDFDAQLEAGEHPFQIKYFYQKIQNQLGILYKTADKQDFEEFEKLVIPIQ